MMALLNKDSLPLRQEHKFIYGTENAASNYIGYGVDNNYVRCMAASIASICVNNKSLPLHFLIVTDGLSQENMQSLGKLMQQQQCNMTIYEVDTGALAGLPVQSHFPAAIYYRFLLPLLCADIERILYLDADIINLASLAMLFQLDLQGNIIAAVDDVAWMAAKRSRALGLTEHRYFNSGVILLDVRAWNESAVFEQAAGLLASEPAKYRYPDQDVLNIILQGRAFYLDRAYNCLDINTVRPEDIVLLHFAAHPKPWNIAWPLSDVCNEFNRNIYSSYEALTEWRSAGLELPKNNKERRLYARALWHSGQYGAALGWYIRYIGSKLGGK